MSKPIVVIACMLSSSESWEPQTAPTSLALTCRWRSRPQHQFRTWVGSHLRRTVGLMTTSNFSGPGSSLGARRLDAQAPYAWLADVIEKVGRSYPKRGTERRACPCP